MSEIIISRQPVLDKYMRIYGYHIIFKRADGQEITPDDIANTFTEIDINKIIGENKGFIEISKDVADSEILKIFPSDKVSLSVGKDWFKTDVMYYIEKFHKEGFDVHLNYIHKNDCFPVFSLIDYIFIDVKEFQIEHLKEILDLLEMLKAHKIAKNVETKNHFNQLKELNFDLYEGNFFAKPSEIKENTIDVSKTALIEIYSKLKDFEDLNSIEETFKKNPDLSIKLLKYVNSAAFSFRSRITSIKHALALLGQKELLKWTLLALYQSDDYPAKQNPLLEMAAVRGKIMEILATKLDNFTKEEVEESFLAGVLSLADTACNMSIKNIIEELNLSQDISDALLERKGKIGKLLYVVENLEKIEETDVDSLKKLVEELNLNLNDLLAAEMEAYLWINDVNNELNLN
jgi:EAL and modified HD-GYP domain-containing signal transduction protein